MQGPGNWVSYRKLIYLYRNTYDDNKEDSRYLQTGQWKMTIRRKRKS